MARFEIQTSTRNSFVKFLIFFWTPFSLSWSIQIQDSTSYYWSAFILSNESPTNKIPKFRKDSLKSYGISSFNLQFMTNRSSRSNFQNQSLERGGKFSRKFSISESLNVQWLYSKIYTHSSMSWNLIASSQATNAKAFISLNSIF